MGGKWNRKRKNDGKKSTNHNNNKKERTEGKGDGEDGRVAGSFHYEKFSLKMESYYAFQGLHSLRQIKEDELLTGKQFVPCQTDEEMEAERKKWKNTMAITLPVSFRIAQDQEQDLRDRMERELNQFMGSEFDISICTQETKRGGRGGGGGGDASSDLLATETKKMAPLKRIPFISHAYQLSIDRRTIRRDPLMESFHNWLMLNSDAGFLSRLETVSMIPPVVLAPEPHHHILDMCAAPGSKAGALLEMIGNPTYEEGSQEPTGFVVANDSDCKRAYTMVNQLRRLNSPALFVTTEDAQRWPLLRSKKHSSLEEQATEGVFDRVLCDVPCSGDGTARKNAGIWKRWSPVNGLSLHPLQLSIALNGAKLTKVGGFMCYSTCSMNPIENEAVVAELLRLTDGSLEIVDRRPELPGISARNGMTSWKVLSESMLAPAQNKSKIYSKHRKLNRTTTGDVNGTIPNVEVEPTNVRDGSAGAQEKDEETMNPIDPATADETEKDDDKEVVATNSISSGLQTQGIKAQQHEKWVSEPPSWDHDCLLQRAESTGLIWYKSFDEVPEMLRRRVRASSFPPSQEEIDKYQLHKCLRILPQDMDTGGFFVALFKKVAPLSNRAKRIAEDLENSLKENADELSHHIAITDETDSEILPTPNNVSDKGPPSETKGMGTEYFVAAPSHILPPLIDYYGLSEAFPQDQIFCRNRGDSKMLYFITASIKKNLIDRGAQERVTVITSGLRVFEYSKFDSDGACYRPVQEGVHYIAPYMTKRKIILDFNAFELCLAPGGIPIRNFPDEIAQAIRAVSVGSFVVALKGFENNVRKKMFVTLWRCRGDVINCLVNKHDMEGLKSKLKAIRDTMESNEKQQQAL